jgi:hypothetical protein
MRLRFRMSGNVIQAAGRTAAVIFRRTFSAIPKI